MNMLPKVLIVSASPLDINNGNMSTLCNYFEDYDSVRLAQIYCTAEIPNTNSCKKFFLVSHLSIVRKLFKWNTVIGQEIKVAKNNCNITESDVKKENSIGGFIRSHRSVVYRYILDFLWDLGLWKNKNLRKFIKDFNPDVIWCESYPSKCIHQLGMYVSKVSEKPSVLFLQDEVYNYVPGMDISSKLRRLFIRSAVKKHIKMSNSCFVASPLMKDVYDKEFGINSIFIAKSFKCNELPPVATKVHNPIRIVYLGNVVYGRIFTLLKIAEALKELNNEGIKYELSIYTGQYINDEDKEFFSSVPGVILMEPVPYDKVPEVMSNNDVLLFVESFDPHHKYDAHLSFSTKITEYLRSGRCIMAIGPDDIAPLMYFKENDAAICVNDVSTLTKQLTESLTEENVLAYASRARKCFVDNHERDMMNARIYGELERVSRLCPIFKLNNE